MTQIEYYYEIESEIQNYPHNAGYIVYDTEGNPINVSVYSIRGQGFIVSNIFITINDNIYSFKTVKKNINAPSISYINCITGNNPTIYSTINWSTFEHNGKKYAKVIIS